jgi:hypothetical protein
MPIHLFRCVNECGHEVERMTRTQSAPVPVQILVHCSKCQGTTRHMKAVGTVAVHTAKTVATAQREDFRQKNPNWKQNIMQGRTADGRPSTDLKQKSMQEWGKAFSEQHGESLDEAREDNPKNR